MTRPRIEDVEVAPTAVDGDVPTVDSGVLVYAAPAGGGSGIPASTVDAKGDLIVGTANDTVDNLPVGAAGTVLIPKSSETTGLKWSTALGLGEAAPTLATLWVKRLDDDYCIVGLVTSSDSADINFQHGIVVKHDALYVDTPGYAGSLQLYMEAGGTGAILGANRYVGNTATPSYAPGETETADGWVRFELGPIWPRSEVGRFNNQGDFIVGWNEVRKHTASQSGTTVTASAGSFSAGDVGKFFCWGDLPSIDTGGQAFADRITGFTSSSVVTVETSRTISSQHGRVCTARLVVNTSGDLSLIGDLTVGDDVAIGGDLAVTGNLTVTGTVTGGTTSTGELLMQDGVTAPPVPLENEARDDWLYQG